MKAFCCKIGLWSESNPIRAILLGLAFLLLISCSQEQPRSVRPPSQKPSKVTSEIGIGDLYAVVVGVSKYTHSKIPQLKFADKDARDFAAFLKTQKELFREIHLTVLLNEQATQKEVKRQLFYELRRAGKNDSVVLFLAGHGADDPNMPGEFFFLTYDADPAVLEGTAVNMGRSWFMQRLDSKRVLVIADTCHAGGFSKDGARGNESALKKLMSQFQESEGRVFLTSSRPDEISREEASLGNGVFTYHLLEGLRGKASRSGDGVVTLQDAYDYVYEKTNKATKGMQHPQLEGKVVGKFPMSLVRLEPSPTPVPQPPSQPIRTEPTPSELERLRSQAEQGDARAQFELGVKYEYGFGVSKDKAEALKWYFKASEQGNGDARSALARVKPASPPPTLSPPTPPTHTTPATVKSDPSKDDALITATMTGNLDDVKRLLSEGADVNARLTGILRRTALQCATWKGHIATVRALLDAGADVNGKDTFYGTALALAALEGRTEVVKLLLQRGAEVNARNGQGRTPLDLATEGNHWEVVRILQNCRGRQTGSSDGRGRR